MADSDPVARARALLANATPGPWKVAEYDGDDWTCDWCIEGPETTVMAGPGIRHAPKADNAELIAAAPTLLAELADEVERLRGVMAQVASDLEAGHERRDAAIDLVSALSR